MSYEIEYQDAYGNSLKRGDRVRMRLHPTDEPEPCDYGVITEIYDPDGDVDDEGRTIGIPPAIVVEFDIPGWTKEKVEEWQARYPSWGFGIPWTAEKFTGSDTGGYYFGWESEQTYAFEDVVKCV